MLTAAALLEFGVSKCLVSVPSPGNHVWRRVGCAPNYSHFRSYDSSQRQVNTQAFKDSIRQPIMVVHVSRRQASFFRYRRHQANQSATFWNRMNIQGTSSELFSDNLAFERYMGFKNRDPTSKFDRIPGIANHSLACFSFRNLKLIRWNGWIPNVFWLTRRRAAVLEPIYNSTLITKFMEWIQPLLTFGPHIPHVTDFSHSLKRFAHLYDEPSVLERDPLDSSSYHLISHPEMIAQRKAILSQAQEVEANTFRLVGQNECECWSESDTPDEDKGRYKLSSSLLRHVRMFWWLSHFTTSLGFLSDFEIQRIWPARIGWPDVIQIRLLKTVFLNLSDVRVEGREGGGGYPLTNVWIYLQIHS